MDTSPFYGQTFQNVSFLLERGVNLMFLRYEILHKTFTDFEFVQKFNLN
jgi:hypothetical protein